MNKADEIKGFAPTGRFPLRGESAGSVYPRAGRERPRMCNESAAIYCESLKVRRYAPGSLQRRCVDGWTVFERYLASAALADLREVTRETLRDYQSWLLEQDYSVATVQGHLIDSAPVFRAPGRTPTWCWSIRARAACCRAARPPAQERADAWRKRAASCNAPDTQTPKGIRDRAILEMFYSTGLRRANCAALTVHDVDPQNGFVRVNKGKGGKDRVVPMGSTACRYRARISARSAGEMGASENREEPGVVARQLRTSPAHAQADDYAGARATARRPGWRSRHAARLAAHLRHAPGRQRQQIVYVQRLLGHHSLETTQIYTRVAVPELRVTGKKTPRAQRAPKFRAYIGAAQQMAAA